jgi:uncharacterized protein YyaL (SSP411 family)
MDGNSKTPGADPGGFPRSETGERRNRLAGEKSPYLLQHAGNPVDWYPWGEEAFEKARREDKPIFLSIGYSTCHWCHVMEHESFEDAEVAALLNDVFVCIKVDREERPDIDAVYMSVCHLMTGSGGWPLTIIMTHERKPFFAATYLPKESRFGRIGLTELAVQVREVWKGRRAEVDNSTAQITGALLQMVPAEPGEDLGREVLDAAFRELDRRFDDRFGGFGSGMKFPTPHNLFFLLRYWHRTGEDRALEMVEKTLRAMRRGGIYDHVGFGFHRYSTDAQWLTPHFEKMLYDQALLALAYIEAFQATGEGEDERTAREIFTYVLRDMTAPSGAFYSAEDADSEGEEGKFYLWTHEEVRQILGADAGLFVDVFNVQRGGNFRDPVDQTHRNANILHCRKSLAESAEALNLPEDQLAARLEKARARLFLAREQRVRPLRDDKVLTDWNGLMIAALARGGQVFEEPSYLEAARRAADFVLQSLRSAEGRLLHRYRDGEAAIAGHLDDYAFLVFGLIELYEAGFDVRYLQAAVELTEQQIERFWDPGLGGFFLTSHDAEALPLRPKEAYDGDVPSGNSMSALNLLRLGRIRADAEWERGAAEIGRAFAGMVRQSPAGFSQLLAAVDYGIGPSYEVVIAGDAYAAATRGMLQALRSMFLPNVIVLLRPPAETDPPIAGLAPYTKGQRSVEGKATAYVCRGARCERPTWSVDTMLELLTEQDF